LNKFRDLDKFLDRITSIIVIYSLSLMLIVVSTQVFCRYVLRVGFYWMPELARYLMVNFTFLAGSIALRRNELVGVTFVVDFLSPKIRWYVDLLSRLLIMFFLSIGIIYGFKVASFIIYTGQLSPGLKIPIGFAYLPIPLAFTLMLFISIVSTCDLIFGFSFKKRKL